MKLFGSFFSCFRHVLGSNWMKTTLKIKLWTSQPLSVNSPPPCHHCCCSTICFCTRNRTFASYYLNDLTIVAVDVLTALCLLFCGLFLALTLLHCPLWGFTVLVHLFLLHFSLSINSRWLCEQTVSSAVTFWNCLSRVFRRIGKSALILVIIIRAQCRVFPLSRICAQEREKHSHVFVNGLLFNSTQLQHRAKITNVFEVFHGVKVFHFFKVIKDKKTDMQGRIANN